MLEEAGLEVLELSKMPEIHGEGDVVQWKTDSDVQQNILDQMLRLSLSALHLAVCF